MAWFRLESSFHSHPKVERAGNTAIGLWVRCATWSANYKEDGRVPLEKARTFGSRREIDRLVDARLWVPTAEGLLIPDFLQYNPSKDEEEERLRTDAERKRLARRNGHVSG